MSGASENDYELIREVVVTGRKAGWGPKEWAKLAENEELMRSLLPAIRGKAEVAVIINCSKEPFVPRGLELAEYSHQLPRRFNGNLIWGRDVVICYNEMIDHISSGFEIVHRLQRQSVLTAHVLDHLLKYPDLIPDHWKRERIYFWGTIYKVPGGSLVVRYLEVTGGGAVSQECSLDSSFGRFPSSACLCDF